MTSYHLRVTSSLMSYLVVVAATEEEGQHHTHNRYTDTLMSDYEGVGLAGGVFVIIVVATQVECQQGTEQLNNKDSHTDGNEGHLVVCDKV